MSFKTSVNLFGADGFKTVGCYVKDGRLIPALSAASLNGAVPEGIIYAAYSESQKDFFLCARDGIYTSERGYGFMRIAPLDGEPPFLIEDIFEGKTRAVLLNGSGAVTESGGRYGAVPSYGASLGCGVMHCGRLFGADKDNAYKLRWSGEGGFSDWKEGLCGSGSLDLDPRRGEILDIVEFGEKLVAVRKFGLTVLNMYGSPENFSAEITDTDTDEIYKGTARVVCGKLVFFTVSGLHTFNGGSVNRVKHAYVDDISEPVCSAELGGKYFLGCKSACLNGGAVFCYDFAKTAGYLIAVSADAMCSDGHIYIYNGNGAYRLEDGGRYAFIGGSTDFGSDRFKTVTEIFIGGRADIEIGNGRTVRKFLSASGRIRPAMRGKKFTVRAAGSVPVRKLTITAEECNAI